MKFEHYFRNIDPPQGGLERLRSRLHGRPRRAQAPLAWASALAVLLAVASTLIWSIPKLEERRFLLELEAVFRDAKPPEQTIDGHELRAVRIDPEGALVYWLDNGVNGPNDLSSEIPNGR